MASKSRTIAAAAALGFALATPSHAIERADMYGSTVDSAVPADRTIVIDNGTRWINVAHGETVQFVVKNGSSDLTRLWRFDGVNHDVPFSEIAPGSNGLRVYVDQTSNPNVTTEDGGNDD